MLARPFHSALLLMSLAGCAGLPKDVVQFDHLSGCPKQTAATLFAEQDHLGPLSDRQALACALSTLRNTKDPVLRRSALGSRLCLNLAEREVDPKKREKLAAEGVAFAEAAILQGGENDGAVHYYLATNLGLVVREHIGLAMENLDRLENEMKLAMALSPDIDDGGPLRLLGMLYLKAPAWPTGIGDQDKATELLAKAVRKHPDHPLNHLFYAQALWDTGDGGASPQVNRELALGIKLLLENQWGYRKGPWQMEFDKFEREIGENGTSTPIPVAQIPH